MLLLWINYNYFLPFHNQSLYLFSHNSYRSISHPADLDWLVGNHYLLIFSNGKLDPKTFGQFTILSDHLRNCNLTFTCQRCSISTHMDSVDGVEPDREVLREGDIFYSSVGILGADDRAGMAIVMAVICNLGATAFNGKPKVAFTREKEIGRRGSQALDTAWLQDVE